MAYKLALPRMGIFSIRNVVTGRMLLDQSSNLTGSLNRHRMELQWGVHRNRLLMADWHAYGEARFSFEVVEQIHERHEPDFDYRAELVRRTAFWRAKIPLGSSGSYL
ncbi:hypothetical protein HDE78_001752 [Rhodanobacter sp. K2T2]|uniref:GIY-YIG nuclease family protein n=1 Tax=Rhodanobacter sp. K2T2 TaxID=2723085 RepID=UPI0015C89596|nr:GIY-YIG nuclease family protein [Rhodanobacter sp. K2T2]NYE28796.1 hypothetical protein [Rhodanobacter sp. K2T2]